MFLCFLWILTTAAKNGWDGIDRVLISAIEARIFPGCSAAVIDSNGALLYAKSFGRFVYPDSAPPPFNGGANPPVDFNSTRFDLASLSKIVVTTSVAALLYDAGLLELDAKVTSLLGPAFGEGGKENITLRHLLLHAAGFPPDPSPGYSESAFGCPGTGLHPPPLDFSCTDRVFNMVLSQSLVSPPGSVYLYSDLSMITLAFALGKFIAESRPTWGAAGAACASAAARPGSAPPGVHYICAFEAFWRANVSATLGLSANTGYLPSSEPGGKSAAAPTWMDDEYRHEQLQGVVSDENSYAAGGILGHAGLFATGSDAVKMLAAWGTGVRRPALLSDSTVALLTAAAGFPPGSPRALGWDTQAISDSYQGCSPMAPNTAYHTGYTGTLLCRGENYSTLLLAARVYPNKTGNVNEIHATRQAFNAAVADAMLDSVGLW